ncbi:MAG: hypothetical protein JWP01_1169 [Myxococcales bacterium]|nr:hypothetical protein [Myxococcales bacterium]
MAARQPQQEHKPTTTTATETPSSTSSSTSTQFSSRGAIPPVAQEAGSQLPGFSASQQAFGQHDISAVQAQAHTGGPAAIGAQAYATGTPIHLGGELEGGESEGDEMLGHEASHVVQQKQGRVKGPQI